MKRPLFFWSLFLFSFNYMLISLVSTSVSRYKLYTAVSFISSLFKIYLLDQLADLNHEIVCLVIRVCFLSTPTVRICPFFLGISTGRFV